MKKLLIFVISLFVCVGVFQTRVMADNDPLSELDWPTDIITTPDEISYNNNQIPNPFIINSNYYGFKELGKDLSESYLASDNVTNANIKPTNFAVAFNLDSSYPEDRKRSKFGISWAEAVCLATEREYDRLHQNAKLDLSEMRLAWFSYNNDGTTTTKTGTDVFNIGGSPAMATLALANGIGFSDESKFPMKDSYSNEELATYTNSNNAYNPDYILNESEWFPLKTDLDIARVKKILSRGTPLAVSFHLSDEYLKNHKMVNGSDLTKISDESKEKYRIDYKDAVYLTKDLADDLNESIEPNYSGVIVGWADDYGVDNYFNIDLINTFNLSSTELVPGQNYTYFDVHYKKVYWRTKTPCEPTGDGVWIVKVNTDDNKTRYYNISYEDASISNSLAVYLKASDNTNSSIVRHELDKNSGFNYYEDNDNEALFYNVYTPQKKEYIDSIGLFTYQNNVDYKVYVYAGDLEKTSLKDILDRKIECIYEEGTIRNAGYHKINLKGGASEFYNALDYAGCQDQKLYAIVKYTTAEGTKVLIPTDGAAMNNGVFVEKTTATDSLTSVLVDDNTNKDLVTLTGGPAKIKLFTYAVDNNIIYHLDDDVTIPEGTKTFYKNYSELDHLPTPTKEGHEFYDWYVDSDLSDESRIRRISTTGLGNVDLYPAFKQRLVFKYQDNGEDTEEVVYVNDYEHKLARVPNIEVKSSEAGMEFAGWEYTDSKDKKYTLNLYDGSVVFDDAKLNGADIVLTPKFEKVTPKEEYNVNEIIESPENEGKKVIYVSPASPQIISVIDTNLDDAVNNDVVANKAILWVEANEIKETKGDDSSEENEEFKGFKEIFEKTVENITYKVCKLIDINLFAQEKDQDEGTKVAELNKEIQMKYDLSGDENAELREAAEKGQLHISQMHNGKVMDINPSDISYNKEDMILTFPVQKFSIFAFSVGTPTEADTPSGESDTPTGGDTTGDTTPSGEDKNKSTDNKSTDTSTPNPDFKTPNTGIH